ncbi:MAG TPA: hypothetical protein DC000_06470 [Clostridiales bacterium]|nr:hypothetical protein [Clostridiales bacterium]
MFIGDGMSYPQVQATNYYKGVLENGKIDPANGNYPEPKNLLFTKFPVVGSVTTYDSTSLCPDSASTATSLSTGKKTLSSVINMDETKKVSYETITEKLKKQLGYKVGIVTSVNIDHATPAAYYSHVPSRGQYYNIGLDLIKSGFDYFAGGAFLSDSSKEVTEQGKEKITALAQKNGYTVADTKQEFNALTYNSGKVAASDIDAKNKPEMVLTDYELESLKNAYDLSMKSEKVTLNQEEYVLYGTYEPFSVTLTHVLNNKSGISFSSYSHTGLPVPLFAKGQGQELFNGYYDNTDVFNMLKAITKVK